MGAETIAIAALSAAASGASYFGQRSTNRSNQKIASEANESNETLFHEANAFNRDERLAAEAYNTRERVASESFNRQERLEAQQFARDMWKQNVEYNSPAQQAQRLRDAGFNPANMLDTSSVAPLVSSPSPATSHPQSVSPTSSVSPPSAMMAEMRNEIDMRTALDGVSTLVGALDKKQDIIGKSMDNETRSARNQLEIENLQSEIRQKLENRKLTRWQRKTLVKEYLMLDSKKLLLENQAELSNVNVKNAQAIYDKQVQEFEDKHNESLLRQSTEKLQNRLSIAANSREERALQNAIKMTEANITKMVKDGRLVDSQVVLNELSQNGMKFDLSEKELQSLRNKAHIKARSYSDGVRVLDDVLDFLSGVTIGKIRL